MRTRAAVLHELGVERPYADTRPLRIEELDLAAPRNGELLLRVGAAGLCHSDLSVVDGTRPRPVPMVLGHEAAGVVESVGPGVSDVRQGDHVVLSFVPSCGLCAECAGGEPILCAAAASANGEGRLLGGGRRFATNGTEVHHHLGVSAFSERIVVARPSAVVIDPTVPLEVAALFGCAVVTGVGAVLNTARVRPGDSVAVFGLGGVGLAAVMGAVLAGAGPIVAVDPVPFKRELALELGATTALDPAETEDVRVRYAFEAAGSPAVLEAAYAATARGGTTVAIGLPHPARELRLNALSLVAESRTLAGSYLGSSVPRRDVPLYISLWQAGRLPVERLQAGTVALDGLNAALDALADGGVVRQIVVP
ncbi:MAG: alcohol dehydrogenase catalytic domain-containing protein [Actinobacteria bacterium]|nr:alcohol dehydrogenase catalytic domain-containing protein [Actinomycetota bacterium]